MGINQLYNHVPYWASYSGAMSLLSIRPNLASYQADAIDNKMGINKLRRLVSFIKANPQTFNSEERTVIRGMILEPVINYTKNRLQAYRLQALAQKGIKLLDKADKRESEIVFVEPGPTRPKGMRPQIDIWQSTGEEPQVEIIGADLKYIKEKKNDD